MGLRSPSDHKTILPESKSHGGNREVPRNGKGQPLIRVMKPAPIKRDPGRLKEVEVPYTRMTTYIDVLDDKTNLTNWKGRKVFEGVTLLSSEKYNWYVREFSAATQRNDKRRMNQLVKEIQTVAGADDAAEKGTYLHDLSEYADQGLPIPKGASEQDLFDIAAYSLATVDLDIQLIEKFVILDEYKVGGTPDRVSKYAGLDPDGNPAGTLITDLKTGTTTYGGLKMSMQLAGYAHSQLYDKNVPANDPNSRLPIADDLNLNWGLIINAPAGSGECTIYWIDLKLGWEAFQLAGEVREMRRRGRHVFRPYGDSPEVVQEEDEDDQG